MGRGNTYKMRIHAQRDLLPAAPARRRRGIGKHGRAAALVAHEHAALAWRHDVELGEHDRHVA
jgi:hypothetical protein